MSGRDLLAGTPAQFAGWRTVRRGLQALAITSLCLVLTGAWLLMLVAADLAAAVRSGDPAKLERHLDWPAQRASLAGTLGGIAVAERDGAAARFLADMSMDVLLGLNSASVLLAETRGRLGPAPELRLRFRSGQGLALELWPTAYIGPPILLRLRPRWGWPPQGWVVAVNFPD